MRVKLRFLLLVFIFSYQTTWAKSDFMPSNLILLDNKISHHVILVEKSTHTLSLFRSDNGLPKLIKSYRVATGKYKGDKVLQGDKKTPEGIYDITKFIPSKDLISKYGAEGEIYGAGAFVLNYPNYFDRRLGKSGGGIWLHSTNDNSRISKGLDSRGCVVTDDRDLIDISRFIDFGNTHFIIVENLHYLTKESWNRQKEELTNLVSKWSTSWREENFDEYIKNYHPKKYRDNFRKSFAAFKNYKKSVFSNPGKPLVEIFNLSIIKTNNYAKVQFIQKYKSNTINDQGLKTLFLEQDKNYEWKIVNEAWKRIEASGPNNIAFSPSQRFFIENNISVNN